MYLELTLSLLLPTLLILLPITLPFSSFGSILSTWLSIVVVLTVQCVTLLNVCTPHLHKPTTRYDAVKRYLTKDILLLITSTVVFSYFTSALINIWYEDAYQDNLAVFWCMVTALYFVFDIVYNHHYVLNFPTVKLKWFYKLKLNYMQWIKTSFKKTFKIVRVALPLYILFYKHITYITSTISTLPTTDVSYLFLVKPSACLNIFLVTFYTYFILHVGHQAVIHALTHIKPADVPVSKSLSSLEQCVTGVRSADVWVRYHAYSDLARYCKHSYLTRQQIFSLHDGHPVLWHHIYKDWLALLVKLNKSLVETPDTTTLPPAVVKPDSVKPVGRDLQTECTTPTLYSTTATPHLTDTVTKQHLVSEVLSKTLHEAVANVTAAAKLSLGGSKVGKYMISELPDVKFENKLSDIQLMLCGAQICSVLCCAARTEDKYGVVQLVLPEILDTVTGLVRAIDTIPVSVWSSNMSHLHLRKTLLSFLHQTTQTYQHSLFNLTLNTDTATLLHSYFTE